MIKNKCACGHHKTSHRYNHQTQEAYTQCWCGCRSFVQEGMYKPPACYECKCDHSLSEHYLYTEDMATRCEHTMCDCSQYAAKDSKCTSCNHVESLHFFGGHCCYAIVGKCCDCQKYTEEPKKTYFNKKCSCDHYLVSHARDSGQCINCACIVYREPTLISTEGENIMSDTYRLWQVAAIDPVTGNVVLPVTQVSAKNESTAKNKAVGMISKNLPEGQELDVVLDEVEVVVRPF